jgi:hypothetical protein
MDTEKIVEHIKTRFDHYENKKILQEKYHAKLLFAYSEGMWKATPELISLLNVYSKETEIVIEDEYNNPIKVVPDELLELTKQHHQEIMNLWYNELLVLKKER